MKNNPFITVLLLFAVQVLLIKYLDYIEFESKLGEGFRLAFICFFIPFVSVFLNLYTEEYKYKKAFRYFTYCMLVISILAFVVLGYLAALGRAYQH